jgi:dephospho-CoA kinase
MFANKPIIGLVGGIGSGKSFVAKIFAEQGCLVIDSDAQVRLAYEDPEILATLKSWWGPEIFVPSGRVDRSAIAQRVFSQKSERQRLEELLHPWVDSARKRQMQAAAADTQVVAFVWDTPLLVESGLYAQTDAIVLVDAPADVRLARVKESRGWTADELRKRENLQSPLDKKRKIADYVIVNTAEAERIRGQVREILSRILSKR